MDWTFGTVLWSTLLLFFWFAVIWMFIALFADVLRRDMSGWAKAGWVALIVLLPFVGILAYLIARPKDLGPYGARRPRPGTEAERSASDQIATAARLYDQGKINGDEYEALKHRALAV